MSEPADHNSPVPESALIEARRAHPLSQQIEALLFVADAPITAVQLAAATERPVAEVRSALHALHESYQGGRAVHEVQRAFELREIAGGYRFYVRESLDPIVADAVRQEHHVKLSQAALETLAVIAYRQPISRGAIAAVRAVNVDGVVRTLLSRGLITEVGHEAETGAVLYGTDERLLRYLGLSSLDDLPPLSPLLDEPNESFEE